MVDFWAPWCGPCLRISPIVEKFSEEFNGKLKCCKLNVDENPKTAMKYQVMSIPLPLFFRGGQKVDESLGRFNGSSYTKELHSLRDTGVHAYHPARALPRASG